MSRTRFRGSRSLALVALAASASIFVYAVPAHAASGPQTLNNTCEAFLISSDGSTGGVIPPDQLFPLSATAPGISGPTEVNAHATFNGIGNSISVPVPDAVDTKVTVVGDNGVVPVEGAANLRLTIEIDGAASIGTPSLSGGNVFGATATKQGSNQVLLVLPGKDATDKLFGDPHWFVGGTSFTSPKLTIPITAGNAGTTVTAKLAHFESDALADVFAGPGIQTRAICTPDANTLGTVQVVAPPPPGAPNAVADVAQTDEGKATNIDVLANDTPNAQAAIEKDSLAITANAGHGTAKVNADHTVTYTPANDFAGTDTFTYKLCSVPEAPSTTTSTTREVVLTAFRTAAAVLHCDTAKVTVTVIAPVKTLVKPTLATTPTTVAAAAELPKTGSSSTPLALVGGGLVAIGLGAAGLARRRRPTVS